MKQLFFIISQLLCLITYSQKEKEYDNKILIIKVYNDSSHTEESICLASNNVKLVNYNNEVVSKFKNFDAYIFKRTQIDSLSLKFLSLNLPLTEIFRNYPAGAVSKLSLYINPKSKMNDYSLTYYNGAIHIGHNYGTALYQIFVSYPIHYYDPSEKKYVSKDKDLSPELLKENFNIFLENK